MKTSFCKPNNPNQGGSKKQFYAKTKRKLYTDPPIRIECQTEDANSKPRAHEKVKVKEYVDPADPNNKEDVLEALDKSTTEG